MAALSIIVFTEHFSRFMGFYEIISTWECFYLHIVCFYSNIDGVEYGKWEWICDIAYAGIRYKWFQSWMWKPSIAWLKNAIVKLTLVFEMSYTFLEAKIFNVKLGKIYLKKENFE